jgi:hypothetical protein
VPEQCGEGYARTPIINVQYTVINDEDSGNHGYWALDNYLKSVIVWQGNADHTHNFCALVQYFGSGSTGFWWWQVNFGFQTFAGAKSPGFGVTEAKDGAGNFYGSRVATFKASLLTTPLEVKTGSFGTVDFKGTKADIIAGEPGAQFNATSWLTYYFHDVAHYNDVAWSWVYTYTGNPAYGYYGQLWVDSSDATFGDILT